MASKTTDPTSNSVTADGLRTPISRRSSISSEDTVFGTAITPPPEVVSAQYSIAIMQGGVEALEDTLERLQQTTLGVGMHGSDGKVQRQLEEIRTRIESQEKIQREGIDEINLILNDILNKRVIDEIQKQVEEEVDAEVDRVVEQQVQDCLEELIPKQLQTRVNERKVELETIRRDLHNSESRRANALLREKNQHDIVHTILHTDGSVSEHFPTTLKDLFDLSASDCTAILKHYGLDVSSQKDANSRKDTNMNCLLRFLNVGYQIVRSGKEYQRLATTF